MDGEIRDTEIMKWCNETLTKNGKNTTVTSFKEKDLALAAIDLCDIISPGSVDYKWDIIFYVISKCKIFMSYFYISNTIVLIKIWLSWI